MKPIPIIVLALFVFPMSLALAAPKSGSTQQQQGHQEWVRRSLEEMQTVKPGMTRGDLEKVFVGEGGLHASDSQTYLYRGCLYFKVSVKFQLAGSGLAWPANPKDKIVSITQPYVDAKSQPN